MKKRLPSILLISAPLLALLTIAVSVTFGTKDISIRTVGEAFLNYDQANVNHAIIMTARLPRVLGALLVGAFLAISGAIMQGMTRNYLASPSIMGVSDGSAFVVTLCMVFLPGLTAYELILFSMFGSALGAAIVFGFGSMLRNGLTPVRLAIIGTVIGTFLSSVSSVIASYFEISQTVSFWYNARIHQMDPSMLKIAVPLGAFGLLLALLLSKSITILSLGDELSTTLGQRTKVVKILAMFSVVLLTGVSVALVGKIGFVGLLIPHITRYMVGIDYKWVLPCTAVTGGLFLAWCDIISRYINYPFETPIGVVTALIGVPFFLYLIRTRGGKSFV